MAVADRAIGMANGYWRMHERIPTRTADTTDLLWTAFASHISVAE